jgi:hypothetical protein
MKNNSNHNTETFSGNSVWKVKITLLSYDENGHHFLPNKKLVQLKVLLN